MSKFSLSLVVTISFFVAASKPCFADPQQLAAWLRLGNGDQVRGSLLDSTGATEGRVRWQMNGFESPFLIGVDQLRSLSYENDSREVLDPVKEPLFLFELIDQQRLIGRVTNCDGEKLTLDSLSAGETELAIEGVISIQRWDTESGSIVLGEALLRDQPNAESWDARGNRLSTSAQNARLAFKDVLPTDATIELEIGWEGIPNFEITLGADVDAAEDSMQDAVRLAVWNGELVTYCESAEFANVVRIASIDDLQSRIKLVLNLKRSSNVVTIRSDAKTEVSTMELRKQQLANGDDPVEGGNDLKIRNRRGTFRIESLMVMPLIEWQESQSEQEPTTIYLTSGGQATGKIRSVKDGVWTIETDDSSQEVVESEIALVRFEPNTNEGPKESASSVRIVTQVGEHFHGHWVGVESNAIKLSSSYFEGSTAISIDEIVRVDFDTSQGDVQKQVRPSRRCKLESDHGVMTGAFLASQPESQTPISFKPEWGTQAALLAEYQGQAVFGAIPRGRSLSDRERVARERARQLAEAAKNRKLAEAAQNRRVEGVARFNMMNMFTNAFSKDAKATIANPKALYLVSGEIVPCSAVQIDENDVIFTSPMTEQTKIPRSEVLALRISSGSYEPVMEDVIRERVMTVPRVNKKDPPTHLLVASNGDLLRCRLIRMNESHVFVESRLEKIRIERDFVAQIIRLIAPDSEAEPAAKALGLAANELDVLAVQKNASRVAFIPDELTEEQLIGNHPHLGRSSVKWNDVSLLSFNGYLTVDSTRRPYSNWRLADAPEPIIADSEGGGDAGRSSKLVGQPAPDFKLELLSGDDFELKRNLGRVVVLDFWASWCGPCMQAMPVIDEAIQKFDTDEVRLVTINLQETADTINRTLKRLKIDPEVALDIDGVAAILYEANAIPQTVIIDPEGVVTRVFVGSGANLGEQLETAINESLGHTTPSS